MQRVGSAVAYEVQGAAQVACVAALWPCTWLLVCGGVLHIVCVCIVYYGCVCVR